MHNSDHLLVMITCLIIGVSFLMAINAENHEVEHEHPFMYLKNTSKGPEQWGDLKPEWESCKLGKFQSPIDLPEETRVLILSDMGILRRKYKAAEAVIKNRGHDIMVEWKEDAGGAILGGTEYKLLQSHWHTPSEHTLQGKRYSMELHMVHQSREGEMAVIAVLYKIGRPDPFLDKVLANINDVKGEEGFDVGAVNPWDIKFGSRKYFRYLGSLTVPPCTEAVVWTLLRKVRTVSREQIRAFRKAVHDGFENNARPIQARNERNIFMYRPQLHKS